MARTKTNPDAPKIVKPEDRIVDVSDVPADRPADETLARVIETADRLLLEKRDLLSKLQEARMLSTFLVNSGVGDREQVEWVRKYLPRKKHGAKDDESEDE